MDGGGTRSSILDAVVTGGSCRLLSAACSRFPLQRVQIRRRSYRTTRPVPQRAPAPAAARGQRRLVHIEPATAGDDRLEQDRFKIMMSWVPQNSCHAGNGRLEFFLR